jgi:PPK2 family polyphosphate:nucleotide phosphotransferase
MKATELESVVERANEFCRPYRVRHGEKFRLKDHHPADTADLGAEDKAQAKEVLAEGIAGLAKLQTMLYAQDRWAVLLVFQAMDAAGKDSTIKHVMSGVNPQGVEIYSFKEPSANELDHDYLWRAHRRIPERGRIGIFNRSYYEEVLIVRVHEEILARQRLPKKLVTDGIWEQRYEDIRNFETYLARNGVAVCKFFLNVSKDEQKKRFLERLDNPDKNWKFSPDDVAERKLWDRYMDAYEQTIAATAARHAPWYVVPADRKWFTRLVVAAAIIDTLGSLDLRFPEVTAAQREALTSARAGLLAEE